MTYASVRAAAQHIAKTGTITPHQLAALTAHDESLTDAQRQQFTDLWRAMGSPAAPAPAPLMVSMAEAVAVFIRSPNASQLADLNACLARFSITTPDRIRHFMAQVGHESGGLRWMLELASGDDYEGRRDLGNTQRGDGRRFKGAGAIQLTGRYNYQRFSDFIGDTGVMRGADYVASTYPFTSAGFWWHLNGMNTFVDQGATCRQVSARVNGRDPANGLADREAYFSRAKVAISGPRIATQQPARHAPSNRPPHLTLTRTRTRDAIGLELLRLQLVVDSIPMASMLVVSGIASAQQFRTGAASVPGSLEPLPEGRYGLGPVEWANGAGNYNASWGQGLGAVWVDLSYQAPGTTRRSALGFHLDSNSQSHPGSAGCVVFRSTADLKVFVGWMAQHPGARQLFVNWGLGTCPKVA